MKTGAVLGNCILARMFADGCGIDRKEQELLESVYRESLHCSFLIVLQATFFCYYKICEGHHMLIFFLCLIKKSKDRCLMPTATARYTQQQIDVGLIQLKCL